MENSINVKKEVYVNLENINQYPVVSNEIYTREKNNRTSYTDNSFIHRSLDTLNNNSIHEGARTLYNDSSNGICTRGNRKINKDESNTHLHRSFVQPDNRFGNRFFELNPTSTRITNTRDIGNQQISSFQEKTQEMEKKETNFIPRFHNFL